jgi:hypothetical protein
MRTRTATLAALTALSLTMAACGGSSDSSSDAADTTTAAARTKNAALPATTTPKTVTTPKPTIPSRNTPTTVKATATTLRATATTAAKPAATTVAPTTVAAPAAPAATGCNGTTTCKVGDKGPAGGIVFYAAVTPQPWGQYMEVKPELFGQIKADTCNLSAYDTYGKGVIGDGLKQLNAVVAACAADKTPNNAGSISAVDAHTQNGFSDWFIPSKDELTALIKSNVLKFDGTKDLTSYTWANKPTDYKSRGFEVLYGVKKENIAAFNADSNYRMFAVEIMSDGTQSYGNPNNRWGWFYIARAFGPKA